MTTIRLDTEAVTEACRRRGLELEKIERDGSVLLLHPSRDQSLPDASQLGEIADELQSDTIRYVTLALDDYRGESANAEGASDE